MDAIDIAIRADFAAGEARAQAAAGGACICEPLRDRVRFRSVARHLVRISCGCGAPPRIVDIGPRLSDAPRSRSPWRHLRRVELTLRQLPAWLATPLR